MLIDTNTQFYFRQPASALADATPIGTGPSFLTSEDLVRGFKVHASAVDPLATPLVAQSIDIETAAYSGTISQANSTGFTTTRDFPHVTDDYTVTLDYIAASSANGNDANGAAISGYKWWNFAYPTIVDSGSSAIGDFVTATGGSVAFGGTAPAISAWGVSYARWADPANTTGWSAAATILEPVPVPTVSVATTVAAAGGGYAFTVTAAGLMTLTDGLAMGTKVKIAAIAQSDGTLKAYLVTYFTNTTPAN
jgi:hypothetical protein